jgi:hypothetical protein
VTKGRIYRNREFLIAEYVDQQKSMQEIASEQSVSLGCIQYWFDRHSIVRRERSEASYVKNNRGKTPFAIKRALSADDIALFYLGVGLYLGEGSKSRKRAIVALGSSDAKILAIFLRFLREICGVTEEKITAELNIYDDVNVETAMQFWQESTGIGFERIRKPFVRKAREGSYNKKSQRGTFTVTVCNTRLLEIILGWCEMCRENRMCVNTASADVAQLVEHDHGKVGVTGSSPVVGSQHENTH